MLPLDIILDMLLNNRGILLLLQIIVPSTLALRFRSARSLLSAIEISLVTLHQVRVLTTIRPHVLHFIHIYRMA